MSNLTESHGACPVPFLQESTFPVIGGFVSGRYCAPVPTLEGIINCCLPCPQTDWVYPDNFFRLSRVANWLNVGGLVFAVAILVSFAVLPIERTHRHYLSVCLVVAVIMMQLGFIIPLGANPPQCYDAITPNDMFSNITCALSGAFVLAGGWAAVMWIFMRCLSLHLQICWQVIPGKRFLYGALIVGWGIPAIGLAIALSITGVSFRFGDTCHINHYKALQDFWGPLLAFAAASTIIQLTTFGYCIQVYLRSLMDDTTTTDDNSSGLPSYSGSVRTVSASQAYRRVRRVIELQWRGIAIVIIIIADVVFFSVVFVYLDNTTQESKSEVDKATPWLLCLVLNGGDKTKCLDLASKLVLNEATVMAVLILLSLNGYWCALLLGRWSMVIGWIDLIKKRFTHRQEFVSVDARRLSADPRTYEMLTSPHPIDFKSMEDPGLQSPAVHPTLSRSFSVQKDVAVDDYFGREARYASPTSSFSAPKAPSTVKGREWDPQATYAKGSRPYGWRDIEAYGSRRDVELGRT